MNARSSLFRRDCGILLHPSSLPGRFGIGDIGSAALGWLHALLRMGQSLWQVLPLNPPDETQSPYQARSAFASDVRLVSLEWLAHHGLLKEDQLLAYPHRASPLADFDVVAQHKRPLVRAAAEALLGGCSAELSAAFEDFRAASAHWLDDYALFSVLAKVHGGKPWTEWPAQLAHREPRALQVAWNEHEQEISLIEAEQFFFERQWQELRECAATLGIRVIGDIPIFVAHNSADVWSHRDLFLLDASGRPEVVAGVPPDYFSKTGQRWGNPLYDWAKHEARGFSWWVSRVKRALALTDIVRVDHFRGFEAHWEIPVTCPTAEGGRWVKVPGERFFQTLVAQLGGTAPIIAEDLGLITEEVTALKQQFGFPGMKVLQFSFGGRPEDLPNRYEEDTVAYTGTHDNDTIIGWYGGDPELDNTRSVSQVLAERDRVRRYFSTDGTDIQWTCIRAVLASDSAAAIVPLQDVLGQGSEARMNVPGVVSPRNWAYRFEPQALRPELVRKLKALTEELGRGQSAT